MRHVIGCCVAMLLAGCSGTPTKPQTTTVDAECGAFGFGALYHGRSSSAPAAYGAAEEAARADYEQADAAVERDRYAEAAAHFMACGGRFSSVPDDDALRGTAQANAEVCYGNALYAFASAGKLASEGRAALEAAAREDPRVADKIGTLLADPPEDCRIPPK